jgi:ubiquitin conjugation factor E4 B
MLYYTTVEIKEPFLAPEVIDRLTAMLNYNLNCLVGPRCTDLKVKNPEEFRFEPKKLLSDLIGIYINLNDARFLQAIARDGRSYKKDIFMRACGILSRNGLKSKVC